MSLIIESRIPRELKQLNDWEKMLIAKFNRHPVFERMLSEETMSSGEFQNLLLQRRFVSLAFTIVYDMVIDGLTNADAIETARAILREEYPGSAGDEPSHRELLVLDLFNLGITREQIVTSVPTQATLDGLSRTLQLVGVLEDERLYQIRLLSLLRFWGEILVSEEYGRFWPRMKMEGLTERGGTQKRSRFYYPHHVHDARKIDFMATELGKPRTHSDRLGNILEIMLIDSGVAGVEHCALIEKEIFELKYGFYDQFM